MRVIIQAHALRKVHVHVEFDASQPPLDLDIAGSAV